MRFFNRHHKRRYKDDNVNDFLNGLTDSGRRYLFDCYKHDV